MDNTNYNIRRTRREDMKLGEMLWIDTRGGGKKRNKELDISLCT